MEAASPPMGLDEWFKTNGYVIKQSSSMGGSSWSSGGKYTSEDGTEFFVKTARQSAATMFAGEALGLQAMYATNTLRIPKVYAYGDDGKGGSYIVMEYLPLGRGADQFEFGKAMAEMHLAPCAAPEAQGGQFGFPIDNTIGGTSQPNSWDSSWVRFFREQRIGHQVKLADSPRLSEQWEAVLAATEDLEALFAGVHVRPSVLHGDLWSGNCAAADGKPCIFDPATYYGHHEAEWGMSWCASLGGKFWEGYRSVIPKDPGFDKRAVLYELYHKLNHYNLFGGGYLMDSQSLLSRLL